jgi:hypothetical protein
MRWWPYAVSHWTNPLFSNQIGAPHGYELAWASTTPSVDLLMWPVTSGFGVLVSYNVMLLLVPPVSAWAAFIAARRVNRLLAIGFLFVLALAAGPRLVITPSQTFALPWASLWRLPIAQRRAFAVHHLRLPGACDGPGPVAGIAGQKQAGEGGTLAPGTARGRRDGRRRRGKTRGCKT